MLKILWKRGKIAHEEQFLPLSTIFYYLMLDFYVKTGIRFSLRDKRLFEITEVEITRVDCSYFASQEYQVLFVPFARKEKEDSVSLACENSVYLDTVSRTSMARTPLGQ